MIYIEIISSYILEWYWLPVLIIYGGIIFMLLIENRNPTKTVAWLLLIVFVPIIGLLFYMFFGRRFSENLRLKNKNHEKHTLFFSDSDVDENFLLKDMYSALKSYPMYKSNFEYLYLEKQSYSFSGNEVKVFHNGNDKFESLFKDIKCAKSYIHLEYYIIDNDFLTQKLFKLLKERIEKGVKVRVILDGFGSNPKKKFLEKLRSFGMEVAVFLPIRFSSFSNNNFRNHRKIAIIDGDIAYVGGINISEKYINQADDALYWRDTAFRFEGNSVFNLELQFWNTWNFVEGKNFEKPDKDKFLHNFTKNNKGNSIIGFSWSDPSSHTPFGLESLLLAIYNAKKSVKICTPYFIPEESLIRALNLASARGIKVQMIVPYKGDSKIVQWASSSFYKPLLQRGVEIYRYTKGFMHAKLVLIDDKLISIGTLNLDIRSFYINFEISGWLLDSALGELMAEQFEKDLKNSEKVDFSTWKKRPIIKRFLESMCRLLAPLL